MVKPNLNVLHPFQLFHPFHHRKQQHRNFVLVCIQAVKRQQKHSLQSMFLIRIPQRTATQIPQLLLLIVSVMNKSCFELVTVSLIFYHNQLDIGSIFFLKLKLTESVDFSAVIKPTEILTHPARVKPAKRRPPSIFVKEPVSCYVPSILRSTDVAFPTLKLGSFHFIETYFCSKIADILDGFHIQN